jgi:hypothetical protein
MVEARTGGRAIVVSGGEIQLNGHFFSTLGYQPPHYQRIVSYQDVPTVSGGQLVVVRYAVDWGLTKGVWSPFKILCYNNDAYDPEPQPYRGQYLFETLWDLATRSPGTPLTLVETQTGRRYRVLFGAEGLQPTFAQQPNATDPETGEDLGPEYEVQVSFFEV